MQKTLLFLLLVIIACNKPNLKEQIIEASCGQCKFGLKSQKGCDLAVKINGKAYFIEGAHIDDFGDAHDKDIGFCNVVRKVEVTGKIKNDRFKATSFKIVQK